MEPEYDIRKVKLFIYFGAIAIILAIAFFIRVKYYNHESMWSDEGKILCLSRKVTEYPLGVIVSKVRCGGGYVEYHPPGIYFAIGSTWFVFNKNPLIYKLFSPILSLIGLIGIFLLGKEIFGKRIGIISMIFLLAAPTYLFFSFRALTEMMLTVSTIFFYLHIVRAIKYEKLIDMIFVLIFGIFTFSSRINSFMVILGPLVFCLLKFILPHTTSSLNNYISKKPKEVITIMVVFSVIIILVGSLEYPKGLINKLWANLKTNPQVIFILIPAIYFLMWIITIKRIPTIAATFTLSLIIAFPFILWLLWFVRNSILRGFEAAPPVYEIFTAISGAPPTETGETLKKSLSVKGASGLDKVFLFFKKIILRFLDPISMGKNFNNLMMILPSTLFSTDINSILLPLAGFAFLCYRRKKLDLFLPTIVITMVLCNMLFGGTDLPRYLIPYVPLFAIFSAICVDILVDFLFFIVGAAGEINELSRILWLLILGLFVAILIVLVRRDITKWPEGAFEDSVLEKALTMVEDKQKGYVGYHDVGEWLHKHATKDDLIIVGAIRQMGATTRYDPIRLPDSPHFFMNMTLLSKKRVFVEVDKFEQSLAPWLRGSVRMENILCNIPIDAPVQAKNCSFVGRGVECTRILNEDERYYPCYTLLDTFGVFKRVKTFKKEMSGVKYPIEGLIVYQFDKAMLDSKYLELVDYIKENTFDGDYIMSSSIFLKHALANRSVPREVIPLPESKEDILRFGAKFNVSMIIIDSFSPTQPDYVFPQDWFSWNCWYPIFFNTRYDSCTVFTFTDICSGVKERGWGCKEDDNFRAGRVDSVFLPLPYYYRTEIKEMFKASIPGKSGKYYPFLNQKRPLFIIYKRS